MWREEVGITEMMLAYIGEFVEFRGWSSWRSAVVDILTCHEDVRRQRDKESRAIIEAGSKQPAKESSANCDMLFLPNAESQPIEILDLKSEDFSVVPCELKLNGSVSVIEDETNEANAPKVEDLDEDDGNPVSGMTDSSETFGLPKIVNDGLNPAERYEGDIRMAPMNQISIDNGEMEVLSDGNSLPIPLGSLSESSRRLARCSDSTDPSLSERNGTLTGNNTDTSLYSSTGISSPRDRSRVGINCFRCVVCNAYFGSREALLTHQASVLCRGRYTCRLCKKVFSHQSQKLLHEKTHMGEKPYICSFCPKGFSYSSQKLIHERIHTGERPYKCSYCSRTFKHSSHKKRHELIHGRVGSPANAKRKCHFTQYYSDV